MARGGSKKTRRSASSNASVTDTDRLQLLRPIAPETWVLAGALALPILMGSLGSSQAMVLDVTAACVGLAGIVAAVASVMASRENRVPTRIMAAWAALFGWIVISSLLSGRGWSAFAGEPTNMLGWGGMAAAGVVAVAAILRREELLSILLRFAWLFLAAQSLIAFTQWGTGVIAAGTLPNSSIFGVMVVLLLPFTVTSASPESLGSPVRWGVAALAVASLAKTGSRAALVVALAWLAWTILTSTDWSSRRKALVLSGGVVAVVAVALLFARADIMATLGQRPQIWSMALTAFAARPVVGWGADGFAAGATFASTPELAAAGRLLVIGPGAVDPHSIMLWVAVSGGIVGVVLAAWAGFETVRAWLSPRSVSAPAWGVAMVFVVSLITPLPLQCVPLLAACLGLSVAFVTTSEDRPASERTVLVAAVAVLGVCSAVYGLNAASRAQFESPGPEASVRLERSALSASSIWFWDAHLAYLSSLHSAFAAQADPSRAAQGLDRTAIERAVRLDRRNAPFALEYARTLQAYGASPEQVDVAFKEALTRYPASPAANAEYAIFLAGRGDVSGAKRALAIAESMVPSTIGGVPPAIQAARDAVTAAQQK